MRSFRLHIVLRVAALGVTLAAAAWLWVAMLAPAAAVLVGLLAVGQVVALVRYVEWTNRELARFLRSVRYADFSQHFSGRGRGEAFHELGTAFGDVMDDFRQARAEKEEQHRYLQTVVQHVGVGLMAVRPAGEVALDNNAARQLLGVPRLRHVRDLEAVSDRLVEAVEQIRAGDRALVRLDDGETARQLALQATEFKLRGELVKLVSLQDIQSELEEKELEAWQQLTRVLTHEIMNSLTPIASLAGTAHALLDEVADDRRVPESEALEDAREAVRTIERRSHRLHTFVEAYRRLTRVPQPQLAVVSVQELLGDVLSLMRGEIEGGGITLECTVEPETLTVTADADLIEQVIINLLRNAVQALDRAPDRRITVEAYIDEQERPAIRVGDNGPGIAREALGKIFIPFFTTKKAGSGIGLSLSREIMRRHGGTLVARSEVGGGSSFTLRF